MISQESDPEKGNLRVGLIGLDSSHCIRFVQQFNDPQAIGFVPGGKVVVAFPGGSPDWELSWSRVDGFTKTLQDSFGVNIVDSPEEVAQECDLIMITSVDGRVHRELCERIVGYGKPIFIDKPLAVSMKDACAISACALSAKVRWFSSSVWRYTSDLVEIVSKSESRDVDGPLEVYVEGPWPLEPGRHGRFWYGIHAVEVLYTVLGTGCHSVKANRNGDAEVISGLWPNGRRCIFSCKHGVQRGFSGLIKREDQIFPFETIDTVEERYAGLLRDLIAFGVGGDAPVSNEETIEEIAFLEAACLSGEMDRPYELSDKKGEIV